MAEQIVRRVVIAGGGTAGWIAAVALSKQLGTLLDITLVESDQIRTVGVGESTVPTAHTFHHLIGIDEQEFMRETGSSFKLGINFENWGEIGDRYIHSFGTLGKSTWMADFHHLWLHARGEGLAGELEDYCLELQAAEQGKFATSDQFKVNYAYHLDAGYYARYLRRLSEAAGVRRVEGKIASVEQHPQTGFIQSLLLESGERIEGDLFIDCTGFRGLLIEQTLKAGFEDWSHWLPNNSALPVQTRSVGPAMPYTSAIAHDAGWLWRIPLQHRVGTGLVYCSDYLSDDEALARLHQMIEGEILIEPWSIRFKAGRRLKVWEKNCIALGLASGFVEPLESTSIHMIMIAVTRLIQLFPFNGCDDALQRRYNDLSQNEIEKIRDFIILHYHLTERDDSPFWRQVRTMEIPDTLAQRLALFGENAHAYQITEELFRIDSWVQVMLGQRLRPAGHHQLGRLMRPEQLRQALLDLKTNIGKAVAGMPSHQDFLNRYCPAAMA
ncbi:tryptophan 7-halogenase [Sphingomonas cavernae]|uniref:Tryptophan 7-halogenase n=1 Tax=Sphingomonas cavernae TaxID=2320861 RepID=A0A418WLA7_9SPHN|nr:tryptophan halogenase family protein [Sphingomonas cavernae]RJF90834.1 tryptophan 7-halogenase [Sphingomonas cavernae]